MGNGLSRLKELWQNTSRTNQIMVATLLAAMILVGIGFVFYADSPDYTTLVSNPAPSDSAKILDLLKQQKVPFRISNDGATIEVPKADEPELKMTLAGQGLLNSGAPGYSLLENAPFGETQAMEQSRIREALEGEMENAIQSLDPVSSASVKYAPGDDSPLVNIDQKAPSASVIVHLKPGSQLTDANIKAIVDLVKSAYTGLSEKNITLVDGEGDLLWDGEEMSSGVPGSSDRISEEKAYSDALKRQIESQIDQLVGPHKSSVLVRASLDMDKQTQTVHTVLPGQRTSKSIEEETLTGGGSISGGAQPAGIASNTSTNSAPPVYGSGNVKTSGGNYSHTTTTETDSVSTSDTQIVKAPGGVQNLRVSIALDSSIPPATVQAVQSMIENYIGASPSTPNRQVVVQSVPFDQSVLLNEKKAAKQKATSAMIHTYVNYIVPLLLIIVMLILLARGLKRTMSPSGELAMAGGGGSIAGYGRNGMQTAGLDMTVGQNDQNEMFLTKSETPKVIGVNTGENVHTFEVIEEAFDANLESIIHLAKSKPETIARLVKSMMSEDK